MRHDSPSRPPPAGVRIPASYRDFLALSRERDRWCAYATRQFTLGFAAGLAAGWEAAMDTFAEELGGRLQPAHPSPLHLRRWFRACPGCLRAGGIATLGRAGCPDCRQRTRETAGLPMHGEYAGYRDGRHWRHHCCPPCRATDHQPGCTACRSHPFEPSW